jgi:hypothetical protein
VPARKNPLTHRYTGGTDTVRVVGDFEADPDTGAVRLARLTFEPVESGGSVTATDLRIPLAAMFAAATRAIHEQQTGDAFVHVKVSRPDGTDRWYRDFAAKFLLASSRSRAPATLIAEQSGVPVATVHRWAREARRRGHLPPDPRGPRPK